MAEVPADRERHSATTSCVREASFEAICGAQLFRCSPLPPAAEFTLAGPEGRHAATVRRLRVGERLDVTDGFGSVAECVVTYVRRDEVGCRVVRRRREPEPSPRLVVVQALAKGDRGERAVEMLTEVGADEIVPWAAARSVVRWDGERGERSRQRWCSTAEQAAKQSRRAHWPTVAGLATTAGVAARLSAAGVPVVLHEQARCPIGELLQAARRPVRGDIVLVVGPEGGIADDEIETFTAVGAQPARMGPTVLRTSTAGVAAAAVVLADIGRWDG